MLAMDRIQTLKGSVKVVRGNRPLLLERGIWILQSGGLAVFAVRREAGALQGMRRYLFTVAAGTVMMAFRPEETAGSNGVLPTSGTLAQSKPDSDYGLLAVALEESEVLQLEPEEWDPFLAADSGHEGVVDWISKLGSSFHAPLPSRIPKPVTTANVSLLEQETFQPSTPVWVELRAGQLQLLGLPEMALPTMGQVLPVSEHLWLLATEPSQVRQESTASLSPVQIRGGIQMLLEHLYTYLKLREQEQLQVEVAQYQAREQLNQQTAANALGGLAGVLNPRRTEAIAQGAPVLIAAQAVGKAMGAAISPPARSEDLTRVKDPIEAITRASRLRFRRVLLRADWWKQDNGPLLAYTEEDNRPVALLPKGSGQYELFDPETQTRKPINAKLAETLAPVAYMFYRSLPQQADKALNLLRHVMRGRYRDLLIVVSLAIGGTLLGMLTPQATAILMDTAIPDSNRSLLLQLGMGLLAAALGSAIFELSQGILVTRLETGTETDMQTGLWDRLLTLPTAFFRRYSIGDLVGRVSAVQQIRQQIGATTMRSILSSIFALLNLALLFTYSVTLTWVALGVALVSILVTTASGILLLRQNQPLLELSGELNGLMVQLIDGVSKLRVAGAEQRAFAHWAKGYQEQVRRTVNIQLIEGAVQTVNQLIPTVTSVLLFWFAVGLIQRAQAQGGVGLTAGTFLAFNSAFGTFMGGMTDLSNTITTSLDVVQLWRRAKVILEEKPEVDPSKADPGRLSGGILLDHITFRYREDGPLTLEDLTVRADPGEFIALVGPSGSGKSTVFRLLLGFDMPLSGTVYFDGQDLAGLDVGAVRKQIGVVLQNSRIMSGSIFDNIAAGALVTLDEAWEAARMAGFAEDVESMPMGMHTVISEGGGNLSGGQRQRLIIARALVLRPKILLFDEATSALDNRTQAIVSASVDRLRATRIVIAHRLSTIRNADRIYVIEAGRVVQQGSFDKLSQEPGLFAELMARQTA